MSRRWRRRREKEENVVEVDCWIPGQGRRLPSAKTGPRLQHWLGILYHCLSGILSLTLVEDASR
jgi:hypothetical protein